MKRFNLFLLASIIFLITFSVFFALTSNNQAPPLKILVENDPILENPYTVSIINSTKFDEPSKSILNSKYELTTFFASWLTSNETRNLINNYSISG